MRPGQEPKGRLRVSPLLWILLVVVYLTLLVTLGVMTFRKGHFVLFGIIFPVLWIIGALMAPTERARATGGG